MSPDQGPSGTDASAARIHPATSIGAVHLAVLDLDRVASFYRDHLGFQTARDSGGEVALAAGGPELLVLHAGAASPRPPHSTGLYHFAVRVPSRAALAAALARIAENGVPLQGASDHGVSEALYLADPEGNGIEIYRDRPREEWPLSGGRVHMTSLPIDLEALLAESDAAAARAAGLEPGTRIGHVHLAVGDLAEVRRFYVDVLGFDETARYGSGALFMSAGGYHHHLAANTWETAGASAPPAESAGLAYFVIRTPDGAERDRLAERLVAHGMAIERGEGGVLTRDPAGIGVMISS